MRIENAVAGEVLERILSSYGFSMQKELAERFDIAKSNVAGWLQRGQIPGNVIVQCSLDTGADVNWLVTGELAKANFKASPSNVSGKALYEQIMSNGGKPVLRRILDAYGFTLQKQLCELLGISSGTVSTWIRREYFPGDVVVACALDTGASLEWLATGMDSSPTAFTPCETNIEILKIKKNKLTAGKLVEKDFCYFDPRFLPNNLGNPIYIETHAKSWIVDCSKSDVSNGRWLIDIDGNCDIYDVSRIPGNKINIVGKASSFECSVDAVKPLGLVVKTFENNT